MLKNNLTPFSHRVRFTDNGIRREHFTDDPRYFERLVAEHGHLGNLSVEPLVLTPDQQARLSAIENAGLDPTEASMYVQWGSTQDDGPYHSPEALTAYQRAMVAPAIEAQRKKAESTGVVVNGIRYAGDSSNRQAIQDALTHAATNELTVFATWKDSDGNYHANVPVADVDVAFRQIANRRNALIELEGQHVADVASGTSDVMALDWSTEYD